MLYMYIWKRSHSPKNGQEQKELKTNCFFLFWMQKKKNILQPYNRHCKILHGYRYTESAQVMGLIGNSQLIESQHINPWLDFNKSSVWTKIIPTMCVICLTTHQKLEKIQHEKHPICLEKICHTYAPPPIFALTRWQMIIRLRSLLCSKEISCPGMLVEWWYPIKSGTVQKKAPPWEPKWCSYSVIVY